MEHKEIYYYNPKYPEHGVETLPIKYVEWITTSTSEHAEKRLYAVVSKVNIETGHENEFPNIYHVYCPYEEDDDMFALDLSGNRERILSFNREKLVEWWKEDVRTQYNIMKKRTEDLEECLNQK